MNNMQLIAQLISSYKMMMKNGILIEVYRTHELIMTIKKSQMPLKSQYYINVIYLFLYN